MSRAPRTPDLWPPRRILCLRLRSMGDAVLLTPALAALRRALPEAEIHVALAEEIGSLLAGHPDVDRIHSLRRGPLGKLALALRLRRLRFDLVFNFHGGPTSALLTAATGAPTRVGRAVYRFPGLYTHRAAEPREVLGQPDAEHTVQVQASLVAALGIPVGSLELRLEVLPSARQRVERELLARGVEPRGIVLLQPTASFATKRWPASRFSTVAREIRRRTGRAVLVSLPSAQEARSDEFSDFPVLAGLAADELLALTSFAALYLGNDSGPMHVAAALGVPVVAVFGSSNPRRWHPWGVPHRALWAGLSCSPCHGKWCENPRQLACLSDIPAEAVLEASLELLGSPSAGKAETVPRAGAFSAEETSRP